MKQSFFILFIFSVFQTTAVFSQGFLLQTTTALPKANQNCAFQVGDWDGDGKLDLIAILKSGTGTHKTEVHILSGASNFQKFILQTGTGLNETNANTAFQVADWDRDNKLDLIAIVKSGTGSKTTEVHILSGASNFQNFILQTGTGLHETNANTEFQVADWDRDNKLDLIAIVKSGTGSKTTEVHILSGASGLKTFSLQTGTGLHETNQNYDFHVADWDKGGKLDLIAIQKSGTGTHSTEVHILSGESGFKNFALQTGTSLHETNENWDFLVADWNRDGKLDVFAIAKSTPTTEVHVVSVKETIPTTTIRQASKPATSDMCWAASQTRGAGTFPSECAPGEDYENGLCYTKCKAGYTGEAFLCWANCPSGFRNDGAFCAKPAPYGRGGGYPWKFGDGFDLSGAKQRCEKDNPQGCEKWGEIMYPKCQNGFSAFACCVCSPICPSGFTDMGVSCTKPNYNRGVGTIPQQCTNGKVNQAGLCYVPCPSGYYGVGPVCWANECPNVYPIRCGAGCAVSSNACVGAVLNQVQTSLEMVQNILEIATSGGGSAVAKSTAKTAAKTIAKETIKARLSKKAKEMGKELGEKALENASNTFYEAQLTGEFSWEDLDPTGIAKVVIAFNKPLCKDF